MDLSPHSTGPPPEAPPPRIPIPEKLAGLFEPHQYKIMHGGRGGAKSWSVARALLILAMRRKLRVLCTREYQVSIADSVHRVLSDQIGLLGFGAWFRVLKSTIVCVNGSQFLFKGIGNDPEQVKSTEGVDICWVEEAQSVSHNSWEILLPTIRKENSETWVTFNPDQESDPTYKKFITSPPPDTWRQEVLWNDNPWFPEALRRQKDHMYATDPEAADHVWGGQTRRRSKAEILHGKWVVKAFKPEPEWSGPYQGVDWGYASSPTTLVRVWVQGSGLERELYIERELYRVGIENNHLPGFFRIMADSEKYATRCDSARPEQISHMRSNGFPRFEATKKWPGSVEDGIAHLRGYYKIVIHPRCERTHEEARLYRRKTDRLTGEVLPDIIDANNHIWDAVRYALTPVIKGHDNSTLIAPMAPTGSVMR